MIFSGSVFILSWICFIFFADKKKFFIFSPTCYIAIILGLITDILIHNYPLWTYPCESLLEKLARHYLDDLGVYFVVTYLFLQTLPKRKTIMKMFLHILLWTIPSISLEVIALLTQSMEHGLWWSLYYSYAADWFLFIFFYFHHQLRVKYANLS